MPIDLDSDVRFPQEGDGATESLLIASLLALFSWLLIPLLPLWGYFARVVEAGIQDAEEPPAFEQWDELTVDGLKVLVIMLLYQLVPMVVIGVGLLVGIGLGATGEQTAASLGALLLVGSILAGGLLLLIAGYILPAAVANYVYVGEFAAAFSFGTLTDVIVERAYVYHWLYAVGVAIAVSVVASTVGTIVGLVFLIPSLIPIIGLLFVLIGTLVSILVSAGLGIYGQIIIMRVWGRGYAEALGLHEEAEAGAGEAEPGAPGEPESAEESEAEEAAKPEAETVEESEESVESDEGEKSASDSSEPPGVQEERNIFESTEVAESEAEESETPSETTEESEAESTDAEESVDTEESAAAEESTDTAETDSDDEAGSSEKP